MAQAPPPASVLAALDDDTWARVVGHTRRVLRTWQGDAGEVDHVRALAVPELLSGAGRQSLVVELATGGALWALVADRLEEDESVWTRALQAAAATEPSSTDPVDPGPTPSPVPEPRDRIRELTQQRDRARRQAEGAEARARAAEERIGDLESTLADAHVRIGELEAQVSAAADERRAALDKQERRLAAETQAVRDELRALRRAEDERRSAQRLQQEAEEAALRAAEQAAEAERRARATGTRGAVAGRPSRLPRGIQPGTSAAARALLTARHRVLVDGYNVTFRNRGHLDLEQQRAWLVALLEAAATRHPAQFIVLFDSRHGSPPVGQRSRTVTVGFTRPGVTADDEIVFDVEAAADDQPILVVTDDRELRDRVRPFRVDVLASAEFVRAVE